jgi:hypothetical protein
VTTPKACSCPAATYNPGQACKHQRKFFSQIAKPATHETGSIRPDMSHFRPVSPLPGEEKSTKASSLSMLIDMHDTTPAEAAYWSIKEDREMWPAEA